MRFLIDQDANISITPCRLRFVCADAELVAAACC